MTKLYTTEEVAEILKYDVQTIRRFIREGKLPGHKIGKEYRIQEEDFEFFLKKEADQR